mgnify:CR=1 FL=1
MAASESEVDVEALLRAAEAADAAAAATLISPEEERVIINAAEALASSEAGVPAKSARAVQALERKWHEFLEKHGNEYGYDVSVGPTIELAKHFQTYGFFHRSNFSTLGCGGMGDSWGHLAVPYLLPKYVFVRLGYTSAGPGSMWRLYTRSAGLISPSCARIGSA